jgi:hypothetical protein
MKELLDQLADSEKALSEAHALIRSIEDKRSDLIRRLADEYTQALLACPQEARDKVLRYFRELQTGTRTE